MKQLMYKPMSLILAICVIAGFVISSCSDDDDDKKKPVDKTVLQDSIQLAKDLLANTEEGNNDGQYSAQSRTDLQTAITAAEAVSASTTVTQTQVDNAVVSLHQALVTYRNSVIAPVAAESLIGHWSFDEGTGTVAHDNSTHGFNGSFKTGPTAWGAGFPTWAKDRKGDNGRAIHVDQGANIEVPYNTNLNPKQLSISLWINADVINANNRFLGLQSWIGYKFQLQEANRPFLTVHASNNASDTYYDRDAEVNLPINEWHHIAVTFGGGKMIFYIDGTAVKTWENTPGEAISIAGTPYNLVFGQDFPTDKYAATTTNFDNDHIIPLDWGGYFRGYLDEIRIYNTPLTDAQIKSIYDREKP
jgi:hypothetical protein